MKNLNLIIGAILLLLLSGHALAEGVDYQTISDAAKQPNDLSRQALVMVFGDVVVSPFQPSSPTLIGSLFALINGVLCSVALFWFLTITLKSLMKSGHEGRVFTSSQSFLQPVMGLAGFMFLVPTASGWSLSQLVMLWAASTMGIGSANLLTNKATDMISSGMSLIVQPTAPSTRQAAQKVFEINLCKYATNRELAELSSYSPTATAPMATSGGNGSYVTDNGSAYCGAVHVPETTRQDGTGFFTSDVNTDSVVAAERQALDTMQSTLDAAAQAYVDAYLNRRNKDTGTLADPETTIQNAAAAYETTVNNALKQLNYKDSMQSQLVSQVKRDGWISLGAWYLVFATANSKTNEVANAAPVSKGLSLYGETGTGDLYKQIFSAYKSQMQKSAYTPTLGTQQVDADSASDDQTAKMVSYFSSPFRKFAINRAQDTWGTDSDFSSQVNPLIKMQELGDVSLTTAQSALALYSAAYVTSAAVDHSLAGRIGDWTVNTAGTVKDALGFLAPLFYFIMFLLFSVGFSLAVFLPAVPFLYWMTGVANWFVSVLVGCAAGPMWAATHLGVEEDRGSRSAYGYIFLIDMMLRPSLMVLGFFFASAAIMPTGTLLSMLFAPALNSANADSIVGLAKMIGWLLVYARIATFTVTRLFGLLATLPDYVIAFLGGTGMSGIMGGMVDNVQGMFGAFGSGAQRTPGVREAPIRKEAPETKDGIK